MRKSVIRLPRALLLAGALMLPAAMQPLQAQTAQQQPAQKPPTQEQARQAMERLAAFRHEPLTEEKAKAAIEVFLLLRQKYPPETFRSETPGPMGVTEAMKRSDKAREILALIKEKGFADIDHWAKTFTSVGMALAHARQGDDNAEAKLKKVRESAMPEEVKQRIIAMLKAVIPPKENVEVARKLLADEQAKQMIEQVEKAR